MVYLSDEQLDTISFNELKRQYIQLKLQHQRLIAFVNTAKQSVASTIQNHPDQVLMPSPEMSPELFFAAIKEHLDFAKETATRCLKQVKCMKCSLLASTLLTFKCGHTCCWNCVNTYKAKPGQCSKCKKESNFFVPLFCGNVRK